MTPVLFCATISKNGASDGDLSSASRSCITEETSTGVDLLLLVSLSYFVSKRKMHCDKLVLMGSQIGLYYLYRSLAECQYVFKDVQTK